MLYHKIHSLWKRSEDNNRLIPGEYSCPEFGVISKWRVDEKIDGTNTVIIYTDGQVTFAGRTNKAIIPTHLLEFLTTHFTPERMAQIFPDNKRVILYGEGYGPKIQLGHLYRDDINFILFDVVVDYWWFTRENVHKIAEQLELPCPPDLGVMAEEEIINLVKSKPESSCSIKPQGMEGVVCRPEPLMLFRNGKPIVWKLKVKDCQ